MAVGGRAEFVASDGIPHVGPGDDLAALITQSLDAMKLDLRRGDVVVLVQKIVSKSEGQYVRLADIEPSARARALAQIVGKDARFLKLVLREPTRSFDRGKTSSLSRTGSVS